MLTDYTDWIGLNADIPETYENNGWKSWKRYPDSIHPASKEYQDFDKKTYIDLVNTV